MIRRALGVALLTFALAPFSLSAATLQELQIQVNLLLEQVKVLQQQLAKAALLGATSSGPCFNATKTLALGMRGEEIVRLQRYLKLTGDFTGEPSGFFRASTEDAVKKWQKRNNIVSLGTPGTTGYGLVGPKTRAAMACRAGAIENLTGPWLSSVASSTKRFCLLGSVAVAHGASHKFYSTERAISGTSCAALLQARTCNDGTLGGNAAYRYHTCAEGDPSSCSLAGTKMAHGDSATLYSYATVPSGESCSDYAQVRTCTNGVLSGGVTNVHSLCVQGIGADTDLFYQTQPIPLPVTTGGQVNTVPTNTNTLYCPYKGQGYPPGMRTEGLNEQSLCLGADLTLCLVGSAILPQFECRNGTWERVQATGQSLPSPTTFHGDCTPADAGCHFCVAGNYGFWTTSLQCPDGTTN